PLLPVWFVLIRESRVLAILAIQLAQFRDGLIPLFIAVLYALQPLPDVDIVRLAVPIVVFGIDECESAVLHPTIVDQTADLVRDRGLPHLFGGRFLRSFALG